MAKSGIYIADLCLQLVAKLSHPSEILALLVLHDDLQKSSFYEILNTNSAEVALYKMHMLLNRYAHIVPQTN